MVSTGPVQVPQSHANQQERQNVSMSDLQRRVQNSKIPSDVAELASVVRDWIPSLRNALPGSFDHLLLLLLDDLDSYRGVQQNMAEALSDYLNTNVDEDEEMDSDEDTDGDSNPETPATVDPTTVGNDESRSIDEETFFNELLVLREMVAPLLDHSKPIYWITNRSHQLQDMHESFECSSGLMNKFVWKIGEKLWTCHGNWSIYNPSLPGSEARDKDTSLHQWRMDASMATTLWEKFPPDKAQLLDFTGQKRLQLINLDPHLARHKGILPPREMHAPKLSECRTIDNCLFDAKLSHGFRESAIRVVDIARWLTLARGFPAVHLFLDVIRLFTVYGLDVSNDRQLEFCQLLLSKQLAPEDPTQQSLIPYVLGKNRVVNETNVKHVQDQIDSNRVLQLSLKEVPSLLSQSDNFTSRDRPQGLLKWGEDDSGKRTLGQDEDPLPWSPPSSDDESEYDWRKEEGNGVECDLDDPATRAYWTCMLFPGT